MKRGMVLKAVNGEDVRGQPYNIQLDAINVGMDTPSDRGIILSFARDPWPSHTLKPKDTIDNPLANHRHTVGKVEGEWRRAADSPLFEDPKTLPFKLPASLDDIDADWFEALLRHRGMIPDDVRDRKSTR